MKPQEIAIQDYSYELPAEKIALHPLDKRDDSKLLIYRKGQLSEDSFYNLAQYIPAETLLIFNDTKVINARVRFKKPSGVVIEIFYLEPAGDVKEYTSIMNQTGKTCWKCFVGGAAKWKEERLEKELIIDGHAVTLTARKLEKLPDAFLIEFTWTPTNHSLAAVIEAAGDVPLPPYIKRATDEYDNSRYQTIFAEQEGSVAAPTAGLHFTTGILGRLKDKKVEKAFVTLHVGAGTFKPVKAERMSGHEMHSEYIDVSISTIQQLINKTGNIAVVGTTSLRTIESIYWLGVKAALDPSIKELRLNQWDVYSEPLASSAISPKEALHALMGWILRKGQENIFTQTQLLIVPGYSFQMANMLITNFHQPRSTLLLLVAAAIGPDWKKMYDYALGNNFRFLSYGDGNLVFIPEHDQKNIRS